MDGGKTLRDVDQTHEPVAPDQRDQAKRFRDHLRRTHQVRFVYDHQQIAAQKAEPREPVEFVTLAGLGIVLARPVDHAEGRRRNRLREVARRTEYQIVTHVRPRRLTDQIEDGYSTELTLNLGG